MLGVVAANAVVTRYYARSIFHRQILRWGVDLRRPREQRLMSERQISEVMSADYLAVHAGSTVAGIRQQLQSHVGEVFVVEAGSRRLLGRLPMARLLSAEDGQTAGELCETAELVLEADTTLWNGLLAVESFVGTAIPVVAGKGSMKLLGTVTEGTLVSAYREAIEEAREE